MITTPTENPIDSASLKVGTNSLAQEDWTAVLTQFEDASIYQTWSYGAVRWGERNLSHFVVRRGAKIVSAAQLRIIRLKSFQSGIAYLRWGPMCHIRGQGFDPELLPHIANALHAEYVQRRGLCLRIIPKSFSGCPHAVSSLASRADLFLPLQGASRDRTFILDLSPSLETLRKQLDQKWRNQLNRAERNGLEVSEGSSVDDFRQFRSLYDEMFDRKKFSTSVDVAEFERICADLPDPLKLRILICRHAGVPVSGIVCSAMGNTGIYLLGATSSGGLQAKGAYLLQWRMIQWLKEHGFRFYDLGGIDPELNPGVYHFKQGMSGMDVTRDAPLQACESILSSWVAKTADFSQRGLRSKMAGLAVPRLRGFLRLGQKPS